MQDQAIVRPGGCVSFWRLSACRLAVIQAALAPFEASVPAVQPSKALHKALQETYGRTHLIRPLAGKRGYCVVAEAKGLHENEYETYGSAWVEIGSNPNDKHRVRVTGALDWMTVNGAYLLQRSMAGADEIAEALTTWLKRNQGVPLRDTGGVYWVPPPSLAAWKALGEALYGAGGGITYNVSISCDTKSAIALNFLVRNHLANEAMRIVNEANAAELGEKALQNRIKQLDRFIADTGAFEATLDASLEDMRAALAEIRFSLADSLMALGTQERREHYAQERRALDIPAPGEAERELAAA